MTVNSLDMSLVLSEDLEKEFPRNIGVECRGNYHVRSYLQLELSVNLKRQFSLKQSGPLKHYVYSVPKFLFHVLSSYFIITGLHVSV